GRPWSGGRSRSSISICACARRRSTCSWPRRLSRVRRDARPRAGRPAVARATLARRASRHGLAARPPSATHRCARARGAGAQPLRRRARSRRHAGLEGPRVDFGLVWPLLGILGAAIIFFVVATLGRGLGERVRTEVALREAVGAERPDPSRHLRAADDALAGGRPREAIHALYLFALTALVAREAIRWDPALTDRELLIRAAGVPHADALRDLVALYE